jgi:predicted nucleic acid-binding protein
MPTLVVDTSIIVKWLNRKIEENLTQADQILDDTKIGKVELVAPEIAKYEVGNVLLKGKQLTSSQAFVSLGAAFLLPITFVPDSEDLAKETYDIAYDLGITYYDAAFLSLAKQYGATLITQNIKHQGKTKDIAVKSLSEYPL